MILRPYQQKGKDDIRAEYAAGKKGVMYQLITSGGKTAIFASIASDIARKGKSAIILVHRQELLYQASRMFTSMGIPHSTLRGGGSGLNMENLIIGSVQTVVRRLDVLPKPDIIVCDEAHLSMANTYKTIFEHWKDAYRLGVTATPKRGDKKGFRPYYESLIRGPEMRWMIDQGFISDYVAYGPQHKVDISQIKITRGEYDEKEVEELFSSSIIIGDAVDHYRKYADKQPAIAFCVNIRHAQVVAQQFINSGYSACHIEGNMNDEQRAEILTGLANGKYHVVTSCNLISEGLDIPACSVSILLRPTKSVALALQQIGRSLRPVYEKGYDLSSQEGRLMAMRMGSKKRAVILDHAGVLFEHGMPDEEREWSLDAPVKKTKRQEKDKPDIQLRNCPSCFAIHEAHDATCPRCGHVYVVKSKTPKAIDGELVELTRENLGIAKASMKVEVAMAKTEEDLRRIARQRGYKQGWVWHMMRLRSKRKKGEKNEKL